MLWITMIEVDVSGVLIVASVALYLIYQIIGDSAAIPNGYFIEF